MVDNKHHIIIFFNISKLRVSGDTVGLIIQYGITGNTRYQFAILQSRNSTPKKWKILPFGITINRCRSLFFRIDVYFRQILHKFGCFNTINITIFSTIVIQIKFPLITHCLLEMSHHV